MKIFTNCNRLDSVGGMETSIFQTTRELVRRGHRFDLIYEGGGDLLADFTSLCTSLHRVRYSDYNFPEGHRRAFVERAHLIPAVALAAKSRPDVYLMNKARAAAWALQAAKLSPAPVVCGWHSHHALEPRHAAWLSAKVTRFTAISKFVRDVWVSAGIDPAKVDLVYPGIDPAAYPQGGPGERSAARASLGIPDDVFVVVFVGRLDSEKGVEVLLDAWRTLGLTSDQGQLLLVGTPVAHSDPQAYLDQLSASAPPGSVRFLGARRDIVTPLHAADVAVVPSVWDEPFGRVVIEAMATGRPVVASRVGAIPEILTGPLEHFMFERRDPSGLAARLSELVGWQDREPGLGDKFAQRVHENFTLTTMVDGIEQTMARALGDGQR